jgi:hypothetical protein
MSKNPEEWESLFVVDHPILKHDWLWEHLKAQYYPEVLDPANVIVDEEKIVHEEEETQKIDEGKIPIEEAAEKLDISNLPPTPEPPDVVEPLYEWQKFLDEYKYDFYKLIIAEDIAQIKSLNLDADLTTLDKSSQPDIDLEEVARVTHTEKWDLPTLKEQIVKQIHQIALSALLEYDRNPDQRQALLVKIIRAHIKKRFLGGYEIEDCDNELLLRRLWLIIDQIRDVFLRPELIEGILINQQKNGK